MNILAIDPGNIHSAYVIMDVETYEPLEFGKVENEQLKLKLIDPTPVYRWNEVVIERIQSYGMAVGREVFETCEWIGRFTEGAVMSGYTVHYINRIEEKQFICHNSRAKDTNIRQALIDRFARYDFKNGKGTKAKPDFFYGFHADIWAAFSTGTTYIDKRREQEVTHQ